MLSSIKGGQGYHGRERKIPGWVGLTCWSRCKSETEEKNRSLSCFTTTGWSGFVLHVQLNHGTESEVEGLGYH